MSLASPQELWKHPRLIDQLNLGFEPNCNPVFSGHCSCLAMSRIRPHIQWLFFR